MVPRRIIIDTDPGIDDSLAILLALASPEVQLEGLTIVHGNCSASQGTRNGLALLELAGATHLPVVKGCELPLVQPSLLAPETHGETGIGYARLPEPSSAPLGDHAVDYLIRALLSAPGEITIIAIGPLTNVALAIRRAPEIIPAIQEIISMGGAIHHPGNTTPVAEFNVFVDPHAAHIVYHAGIPLTLVPLDVTYRCTLTPQDVQRLRKIESPITHFIAEAARFYMDFYSEFQSIQGCVINDPLALALAIMPELASYQDLYIDVDISGGVSMGKTFADYYHLTGKAANMRVALDVRARDFMEVFLERIEMLSQTC